MTTSAKILRELKEFKRNSDMWGPHVSDWVHGELGSPNRAGSGSGEVARPRTCGADAAPHGLTRTHGAEVALTWMATWQSGPHPKPVVR